MKNRKVKKIIIAVCTLLVIFAAALAVFLARDKISVFPTSETSTESTLHHIETEAKTTFTQSEAPSSQTESSSAEEGETKKLFTLTDSPEISGSYEPTEFENALFDAINSERINQGKKALEYNPVLHTLAKIRSDEAVRYWSQTRPDGRSPSSVFSDNSLSFVSFGECLARGTDETADGAKLLAEGLLRSEKQKKIIFGDEYVFLAVAASENGDGTLSAALLFCSP